MTVVRVFELTGGEITTVPYLYQLVQYIINKTTVEQVALLTNGVLLSKELIDFIIRHKNRILIQIDLQSLNDKYLSWFTNIEGTVDIIKEHISILASAGVYVRVACTITRRNLKEMDDIVDWCYANNVSMIAFSVVREIGRAYNSDTDLFLNKEEIDQYINHFNDLNQKYPDLLGIQDKIDQSTNNCGTLSHSISIAPSGDVKICTIDSMCDLKIDFGNAIQNNIQDILNERTDIINEMAMLKTPKINEDDCTSCDYKTYCVGCIYNAVLNAKKMHGDCKWAQKNMSDQLIQFFGL